MEKYCILFIEIDSESSNDINSINRLSNSVFE